MRLVAFWALTMLSIVAGAIAVLLIPTTNEKRIKIWLAVEIAGAVIAAAAMWLALKCARNPRYQEAYSRFCERISEIKERFRGNWKQHSEA